MPWATSRAVRILTLSLLQYIAHGFKFGLSLVPLLFLGTVLQKSAAGIEVTTVCLDVHTAQRHIEMGFVARVEHAHKPAIISAGSVLVMSDEVEGLAFG